MAETKQPVTAYQIDMQCEECGAGQMKPIGTAYLTSPLRYPHQCNHCGHTDTYRTTYPRISYEPITQEPTPC